MNVCNCELIEEGMMRTDLCSQNKIQCLFMNCDMELTSKNSIFASFIGAILYQGFVFLISNGLRS